MILTKNNRVPAASLFIRKNKERTNHVQLNAVIKAKLKLSLNHPEAVKSDCALAILSLPINDVKIFPQSERVYITDEEKCGSVEV